MTKNNIPIFYTDAFCIGQDISSKFTKQMAQGGFRYAMNYAFIEKFETNNKLIEFKSDYLKYLNYCADKDNADMILIKHMTDTLISNVV